MSTSRLLGRTAAAALSSVSIGGGALAFWNYHAGEEWGEACNSRSHQSDHQWFKKQPPGNNNHSYWDFLSGSVVAKDMLLPIYKVQCEAAANVDPSYPDLSRFGKHSYLKRYLTLEIYKELKDKKTSAGVTLEDLIKSGISLPWGARPPRGCGIYAGDEESYTVFAPLFVPILEDYHHFRLVQRAKVKNIPPHYQQYNDEKLNGGKQTTAPVRGRPNPLLRRQVTNLNPGYVLQQKLDPEGHYILHTRMRVARSIKGFAFSPVISREDRRKLEHVFKDCVQDWRDDPTIGGKYIRVMDMTNEQHGDLIQRHILFHDPDEYSLSAGLGRDWPDARGIFLDSTEDPKFMIWLNAEDHLRVISMNKGGDLLGVFTRLSKALNNLEMSLKERGYSFCIDPRLGFLNTSPENLGTALRASVFVKLPRLGQQPGFEDLLDRLRLEVSSRFKADKSTGIFDIANAERLGQSEVQLINTMINGVGILIGLEKKLERGEKVNLDDVM